jgi:hypothetical protein
MRLRQMAWECFPDDKLTTEITERKAFDTEETVAYVTDLDAVVEEQGVLEAVRAAKSIRKELRKELREEGHITDEPREGGNKVDDDDFVHLGEDNLDDDFLAELTEDAEAEEVIAEQRTLMALFKTKPRDKFTRRFMVAERRAAAARLTTG